MTEVNDVPPTLVDNSLINDLFSDEKETKKKKVGKEKQKKTPEKKPKEKRKKDSIQNSSAHKKLKLMAGLKEDNDKDLKESLKKINALDDKKAEEQVDAEHTKAAADVARRLSVTFKTLVGAGLDIGLHAGGKIMSRIQNDKDLETALCTEFVSLAHMLNNKLKCAAMIGSDVFHGKLEHMQDSVKVEEVVEEPTVPPAAPFIQTEPEPVLAHYEEQNTEEVNKVV